EERYLASSSGLKYFITSSSSSFSRAGAVPRRTRERQGCGFPGESGGGPSSPGGPHPPRNHRMLPPSAPAPCCDSPVSPPSRRRRHPLLSAAQWLPLLRWEYHLSQRSHRARRSVLLHKLIHLWGLRQNSPDRISGALLPDSSFII